MFLLPRFVTTGKTGRPTRFPADTAWGCKTLAEARGGGGLLTTFGHSPSATREPDPSLGVTLSGDVVNEFKNQLSLLPA